MTTCEILFDQNDHGIYFAGQIVTGKVVIGFNKKKKLKGIQLKICGYSSTCWKDRRSGPRREHHHKKRRFNGREDYIASNTFLIGSEIGHDVTVDAGTHTFTFQSFIPENCPSSFEGTFGHIRYIIKIVMINSLSKNQTFNRAFTVLKQLDLNRESNILKMPASNEAMQGFCLSTAKPVLLSVDITQTGYVPGQMILVSGDVHNQSNSDAKKIYVFLNLRATYTSTFPRINTKTEKICLVKKKSSPVARRTRRSFTEIIRVPATAPTCEHISKIVRITYEIAVVAVMNGLVKNPKAVIPITIGSIPLQCVPNYIPEISDFPSTSAAASTIQIENDHDRLTAATPIAPEKDHRIQLKICGYSSTCWKDRRSGPRREHHHKKRRFNGREDYIASNTFLIGSEIGHDVTVDAGTHTFTFQSFIPENCPSSFEGTFGHIRYIIKIVMINSLSKNQTFNRAFTVLKQLDLNRESNILKMPASNEAMQGFCLSTAKPVLLSVDITQTGYVPGQMILVSGDVHNQSNSDAKKIYVFLNLRATYTSTFPRINTKTEKICLVKKKSSPVARRTRRSFTEIIRVPATAPTCEHISKIVRITYEIAVVAVMNGLVKNPKAVIPITIGSIPLQCVPNYIPEISDFPSTSAAASTIQIENDHDRLTAATPIAPEKDHPPPTYEEAMFMTTDIGDEELQSANETCEAVRFTPRFPVFDVDGMLIPDTESNKTVAASNEKL